MADAPQTPTVPRTDLDRLGGLHRMSRTAGLGSSEYTAVNIAAVVAVIVGGASALALLSPVFLFLPVIGVIIAAVAVKQIYSSNGTQTGLPLAALAMVLSVALTGFTGLKEYRAYAQVRDDNVALDRLIMNFGKLVAEKKYGDAYAMTDERFKSSVPLAVFENRLSDMANAPTLGPTQGMRSTKLFGIDTDPETNLRMAVGYMLIDTQQLNGATAFRTEGRFRYSKDQWRIFAIPQIFPPAKAAAGATDGGGAVGGAAAPPAPR